MANRLFVYGTLKRGDVRAYLLKNQRFIGEVWTKPRYKLFNTGDYPAMVEAKPLDVVGVSIIGELWEVDRDCLARLDVEEGVDERLYERREIQLVDESPAVESYFYLPSVTGMPDLGERW